MQQVCVVVPNVHAKLVFLCLKGDSTNPQVSQWQAKCQSSLVAGLFQEGHIEAGGPQPVGKQHLGPDLDPQQESMSHQKAAADAADAEGWIGSVALPKVSCLEVFISQLHADLRLLGEFALYCVHVCC